MTRMLPPVQNLRVNGHLPASASAPGSATCPPGAGLAFSSTRELTAVPFTGAQLARGLI